MKFSILTIVFIAFAATMFADTSYGQFRPEGCIKLPIIKRPKKPKTKAYALTDADLTTTGSKTKLTTLDLGATVLVQNDRRKQAPEKTYGGCTWRASMNKHLSRHGLYGGDALSFYQLPPVVAQPTGKHGKPRPSVRRCGSHPCGSK
jgi:hypothetical protein